MQKKGGGPTSCKIVFETAECRFVLFAKVDIKNSNTICLCKSEKQVHLVRQQKMYPKKVILVHQVFFLTYFWSTLSFCPPLPPSPSLSSSLYKIWYVLVGCTGWLWKFHCVPLEPGLQASAYQPWLTCWYSQRTQGGTELSKAFYWNVILRYNQDKQS